MSCNKNKKEDLTETPDYVIHVVEGTLHKVSVTERDVPFVVDGETEYKIYADLSNDKLSGAINKSASFVSEQVENATGAEIEIIKEKPTVLTEDSYAIVYGHTDVFEGFGLAMPDDDIASSGYYIKTQGNVVFIEAYGSDGYRMGGLAFLREVLGYDMISEDCILYERAGTTMPEMEIIERPDFDYRQIQNYYTSVESYGMGMHTHSDIWIPVNGWDMHNSLYYIPPEIYGEEHPDWYRSDRLQPCYTAHGNKAEYALMQQKVFEVIKQRMQECPTLENISFTAMDGTGQDSCWCDTCTEYKKLYGTPAATCIYFMNDLNKLVQAYINENEPGRVMNLTFFAYHDAEPAPVERVKYTDASGNEIWGDPIADENGNYTPLKRYARDEKGRFIKDSNGNYVYEKDADGNYVYLLCDEHVYPWLAPIYAKYTTSFYDEKNASYAKNISAWYAVSSNVYVWLYGTNFKYYLYPYNTWSSSVENYRYLKECGVKYVWNQAQERNQATAFTDLKDYIDSKFLFDVNADYDEVLDKYFDNYYLEASEPMRDLFNLIQTQSAYLESTVQTISGGIYDDIGAPEYWPRLLLEEMLTMIDDAYAAVEKYKATDPTLYENLVRRIKQESIFPRYVICTYYGDYYANIQEIRAEFRDDWNELGFSVYKEADGDMQSVFNGWGL
ncbi:MAG: DUF4838 domain-containing protein [Clostridia bacterium]|nr:DUF4838 domain-containing protein [Clostridia bacterium]